MVFYPEEQQEQVKDTDFKARGYEIHAYVYRENAKWYLVELTNPTSPKTNESSGGTESEPPVKELFGQLNSRLRFPKGMLYWQMPDGEPWVFRTTEPWSVSDWLMAIGLAAAVIGITLATAGAGTAATVFIIGSSLAGAAAAGFGMKEKAEQGMLTTEDKVVGAATIVAELLSPATAGLGKIVVACSSRRGPSCRGTKVERTALSGVRGSRGRERIGVTSRRSA
jgi:hypothetical protein